MHISSRYGLVAHLMRRVLLFMVLVFLVGIITSNAQPVYMMQNATVTDCEGTLTDSENGPEQGQYDHNEIYTFTICVDQASEIIIAFNFFSSEAGYDVLSVFDGPNTASPLIAMLTGSLQPPPVLVATSGCVTFHFESDDNIVAAGWELHWTVEIEDPEAPGLEVVSMLECPMPAITFQFDTPVPCEMLSTGQFSLLGPGGPSISSVTPLDCLPGETGQTFEVVFASPLSQPGTYRLLFNGQTQDACGEWHDVSSNVVFDLSNCPFSVIIELVYDECAGDCGRVEAIIIGDAGVPYTYSWGHTAQDQPVVDICTDDAVMITVSVTDPVSMQVVTAQFNYIPREIPVILNPIQDTICSSQGDHFYQSSLPGGLYTSSIIPQNQQAEGRYQFWRWQDTDDLNIDIVTYEAPNGCETTDTVLVLPVYAGEVEAACLNAPDFTVTVGSPPGGQWQGPHITPGGIFSPVMAGSFVVTYVAANGCPDNKRINVEAGIIMPDVDTICSSQQFDLVAEPFGGRWSGPGIINAIRGRIRPWTVTPNQTYTYVYTLEGCTDSIDVYIQEIWAGPDLAACDSDTLLSLSQPGNWSGPGVYIPVENAFDISMLGPGEYDYTLSANGCTDDFRLYIINPYAQPYEPIAFCLENQWFQMSDFVDYFPDWGSFTGPTISETNDQWYFNPGLAGPGTHQIIFEAAGCTDTFHIAVEPLATIPEYSFCELSAAQTLSANPSGGLWSGPGFLDVQNGLFDPQLLPPGSYPITYTSPLGCVTLDTIDIILWDQVQINGVAQLYCFSDTIVNVILDPADGDFYINGVVASPQFNPAQLGTGTHELFFTRGTGACASSKRIFFSVLLPISGLESLPDSICSGENSTVSVDAYGGSGTLTATWDQGLGFGHSHIVNPLQSTTYIVTVTDGCSDPYTGMTSIHVYQPFDIDVESGPPVCYGDSSYVEVIPPIPGQYMVQWQLDSVFEGFTLFGQPGIYEAEVVELSSGCSQTYDIAIPGSPPLSANFSIIPNQPCIDIIDNTVQIIDLSTGYTAGSIDFGDGSGTLDFSSGLIEHEYDFLGDYTITVIVSNDLGCTDTLLRNICVENRVELFIPNVFSPNGDGINDFLEIHLAGAKDVEWAVFNRYGDLVFEAFSPDASWDGAFNGEILNPDVFVVRLSYTDLATGKPANHSASVTLMR